MKKYIPLFNAVLIILTLTMLFCRFFEYGLFSMMGMNMLMWSWFIVFGVTKLINVSGFVVSFRQYDIVTKNFPLYGYLYPMIELFLGIAYIFDHSMTYWLPINIVTILISWLTTIGIVRSFSHPTQIHCACLGAHTELTLWWITLVECGSMVIMGLGMILWML